MPTQAPPLAARACLAACLGHRAGLIGPAGPGARGPPPMPAVGGRGWGQSPLIFFPAPNSCSSDQYCLAFVT